MRSPALPSLTANIATRADDPTRTSAPSRCMLVASDVDSEALYCYTSGRWLWDEEHQLTRRRIRFNVTGLRELAASAVGSHACVGLRKLSEGSFNKAFLLTMDDGREVVAKLPNPNAGYAHFTTASEVASMNFVSRSPQSVDSPYSKSFSTTL